MKQVLFGIIFLILASSAMAVSSQYCTTNCVAQSDALLNTQSAFTGNSKILQGDTILASGSHAWTSGTKEEFSLTYDHNTGLLTYTVGNDVMKYNYGSQQVNELEILAKTSNYGGNSVEFTNLTMNDEKVSDLESTQGDKGLQIMFSSTGFTLTGQVVINAVSNTNNDLPGFDILLMQNRRGSHQSSNIQTESTAEVPEFGVFTAALALIAAIVIIGVTRRN